MYNRSVRVVRGSIVDKTIHARPVPTENDLAHLCHMYGSLTQGLLDHLKGCRGKPVNNTEYDDLEEQIHIVEWAVTWHVTLVQPKRSPTEERKAALTNLFYETFCGELRPKSGPRAKARPDYVFHARPYIRKLANVGGEAYEKAMNALKYAYVGQTSVEQEEAYKAAVQAVIPPLK